VVFLGTSDFPLNRINIYTAAGRTASSAIFPLHHLPKPGACIKQGCGKEKINYDLLHHESEFLLQS
jgi:hypothetical protein